MNLSALGQMWVGTSFFNVLAQTTGDPTSEVGIVGLIVQVGLSGIFLWQWRSERDQKIKREDQLLEFTKTMLPVVTDATSIMRISDQNMAAVMAKVAAIPDRNDFDSLMRRMETAVDHLIEERKNVGSRRRATDYEGT